MLSFGLGLYAGRRVDAGRSDWFFGDPDPSGEVAYGYQPTGKEEPNHGDDAHDADIPAVGLCEANAHAGDLAANDRADQWPTLRGHGGDHHGATIGAEPCTCRQTRSATIAIEVHANFLIMPFSISS
jgi:hypothetical protein